MVSVKRFSSPVIVTFSLGSITVTVADAPGVVAAGRHVGALRDHHARLLAREQRVGHQGIEHDPLAGLDLVERLLEQVLVVRLARLVPQAGAELRLDDHVAGRAVAGVRDRDLELDRLPLEHLARGGGLLDLELGLADDRPRLAAGEHRDGRRVVEFARP